jgi:hypothetical protein
MANCSRCGGPFRGASDYDSAFEISVPTDGLSSTIWESVKNIGNYNKVSDGHTVYWPTGAQSVDPVLFRGLRIDGRERLWKEVPCPRGSAWLRH